LKMQSRRTLLKLQGEGKLTLGERGLLVVGGGGKGNQTFCSKRVYPREERGRKPSGPGSRRLIPCKSFGGGELFSPEKILLVVKGEPHTLDSVDSFGKKPSQEEKGGGQGGRGDCTGRRMSYLERKKGKRRKSQKGKKGLFPIE